MIKIYVANLGKYNEGELVGEWLQLPVEQEELESFLTEKVGINKEYEEYAIHDYECDLDIAISEYESINNLNEIASNLNDLEEHEVEQIKALLEGGHINQDDLLNDSINSILDNYTFTYVEPDAYSNDTNVGYAVIEQLGIESLSKEQLMQYFDYEAFGRDILLSGAFLSSNDILVEG
jgi:antirestriction protein